MSVTNLTTQNAPLNTIIEITPTGGSISSIESASISFNSNSKTGSFSTQNGKAYFTLTSGTTWNPNTTYTGTINGLLDSDGCETKSCSFNFTTRGQTTLTFQSQNSYHARSSLAFTVANGSITDLSTANISYSGGSINCSLSSNNGNIICSLGENAQWAFNSYLSITISNLKDSEGAPVANSTANFNIGAQPYLSCDNSNIKANSDLIFTLNESTITSLTNANVSFTGANVSGNLQLVNGKVVYKLANNSLYPFGSNATINISGLKDSNGVTVADLSQDFYTAAQTEIESFAKSENLRDNISLSYSGGFTGWNVSNATAVFDNANVSGTFSIENGKILYKLNTGYSYPPSTTVTGKISGIKDADGLPVKDYEFSFETRQVVDIYSNNNEELYNGGSIFNLNKIEFASSYGYPMQNYICDLSNARIELENGTTVNGTLNIDVINQFLIFTPNSPFDVNTIYKGKLTGVKDFEGVTIADCPFILKTRNHSTIQLTEPTSPNLANLNDSIKFTISNLVSYNESNEASNGNTGNISITFDNCSVTGNISLEEDGFVIVFTPSSNQLWPANTTVTGTISGITQNDKGTIPAYNFSFQTQYLKGKGTQNNPWLVSSADDLNNIRFVNKQNSYQYFEQTQDIDLADYGTSYDNGKGWLPIPDTEESGIAFYGHYNGNNHKITNLYINRPNEAVGLFHYIYGEIKNLGIEISSNGIQGGQGAALTNSIEDVSGSGFEVSNCWVGGNGKITCSGDCGGLFGSLQLVANNCYSTVDVEGSGDVGGLCAHNGAFIAKCFSTGTVKNNSSSGATGGLIGNGGCEISNCYSLSSVTGGREVGVLIGYGAVHFVNCYAIANISASNANNCSASGLAGYCNGAQIENCYAGSSEINITQGNTNRLIVSDNSTITNCYAKKDMTLKVNGVSSQPGLQNPLPSTVALDGVDGANLPDNPDWKNDIFKDGYENGDSFDSVWEIGTSGLPILKNMPGNPEQ